MKNLIAIFSVSLIMISLASGQSKWELDEHHSSVVFAAEHIVLVKEAADAEADFYNVGKTEGRFGDFDITFRQSGNELENSKVEALIDMGSMTTENMVRDHHLRSADFFHVDNFPKASFVSSTVRKMEGNKYEMRGELTIKDVTRQVVFELVLNARTENALGEEYLSLVATTVINRHDFGLGWSQLIEAGAFRISNYVTLTIQANLRRV